MFKILIAEDDSELRQLFSHVLIKTATASPASATAKKRWMLWTRGHDR